MNQQAFDARYAWCKQAAQTVRKAAGTDELEALLAVFGMCMTELFNSLPEGQRQATCLRWIRVLAATVVRGDEFSDTVH